MKHDILKIRLINVVVHSLWQPKILTAVKYKTTCEAFLTENSKTAYLIGTLEAVGSKKKEMWCQSLKSGSLVSCPTLNTVYKSLAAD